MPRNKECGVAPVSEDGQKTAGGAASTPVFVVKIPSALSGADCAVEIDLGTICKKNAGSSTITAKDVKQLIANALRTKKAHVSASGREVQWEQVQLFVDEEEAPGQVQDEQAGQASPSKAAADQGHGGGEGDHQATPPGVQPAAGKCLLHSDAHLLDISSPTFLAEKVSYFVKTFAAFENKRALHKALMVVCSADYHTELLDEDGEGGGELGTGFGMPEFQIYDDDNDGASDHWHTPSDYYENADQPGLPHDDTPTILAKLNQTREEIEEIYGPLRIWDCSKITNLADLFMHFHSFNQDISGWDVSGATEFRGMFYGCSFFNHPLESWNTAAATNMYGMFQHCSAFAQDLNKWNVAKVENASGMFTEASSMRLEFVSSWPAHLLENIDCFNEENAEDTPASKGNNDADGEEDNSNMADASGGGGAKKTSAGTKKSKTSAQGGGGAKKKAAGMKKSKTPAQGGGGAKIKKKTAGMKKSKKPAQGSSVVNKKKAAGKMKMKSAMKSGSTSRSSGTSAATKKKQKVSALPGTQAAKNKSKKAEKKGKTGKNAISHSKNKSRSGKEPPASTKVIKAGKKNEPKSVKKNPSKTKTAKGRSAPAKSKK
ncbi:unnamed protein product [Amoebophrya sp. A120]|nr:unnamed protein product [Amoebophrya sp. A120]|eukprot:GSA120T00023411001.1